MPHYDLPVLRILDARDVDDKNFIRYYNVDLFNPLLKAVFIKKIIICLFFFFFGIFNWLRYKLEGVRVFEAGYEFVIG